MNLPELVTVVGPGQGDNYGYDYWIVDAFDALIYTADPEYAPSPRVYAVCDTLKEAETILVVHNNLASVATLRNYRQLMYELEGTVEAHATRADHVLLA